jgi:hypothetical protein
LSQAYRKIGAKEFAAIEESGETSSPEKPFGEKAKKWIGANFKKAVAGTWNVGISVAVEVLTEAALEYFGLE